MLPAARKDRFEQAARAYANDLFRYLYWLCRDRARAEDLTQDTFARAHPKGHAMNCIDFRRDALAQPLRLGDEARTHAQGCAAFGEFLERQRQLVQSSSKRCR